MFYKYEHGGWHELIDDFMKKHNESLKNLLCSVNALNSIKYSFVLFSKTPITFILF